MKRRTTLIALVSSLAVLLTVLLTGCGTAAYSDTAAPDLQNHEVQSDLSQSNQTDPAAATPQTPSYITPDEAKEIALNHASVSAADARWDDREVDLENGKTIYELSFDANGLEYEYDIDARTGEVLKAHSERDDDRSAASSSAAQNTTSGKPASSDKPASSGSDYIGLEKAKSIALQKAGVSASSVRWEKARLDYDDGRAVYELEFRSGSTEYDCEVHAVSGKILDYDAERDGHDDHDHDDRWDD